MRGTICAVGSASRVPELLRIYLTTHHLRDLRGSLSLSTFEVDLWDSCRLPPHVGVRWDTGD